MNTKKANAQRKFARLSFSRNSSRLFDSREVSGVSSKSVRRFLNGRFSRFINGTARSISLTSTRTFGGAFMSFGLISLILHLLEYYFVEESTVALSSLVISAAFALVSIPLVSVDCPISHALQEFPITDYIFFEFFAIKRMRMDSTVKTLKPYIGVIFGIFPAVLGFFWSVEGVVLVAFALTFCLISFISPEFPFLFTLLALPYISLIPYGQIILAAISLLTILSFIRKVLFGKRVYNFEAYDLGIFLLLLIITAGGVIGGTASSALAVGMMISLVLGYIPAANLLLNRRLVDCTVNSITVSSIPVAVVAIVEYATALFGGNRAPVKSTFASPEELAVFLTVVSVPVIFYAFEERDGVHKFFYYAVLFLNLVALAATENLLIIAAVLLCILAYAVLRTPMLPNELIILIAAIPYAVFFLPFESIRSLFSFLGISQSFTQCIADFSESLELFSNNIFFGIGVVEDIGSPVLNMLIGIGCRFGIFALAVFALMILFRLRHLSAFARYYSSSTLRGDVCMSAVSIFALLVMGSFYDAFENTGIFYLFWCIMGFGSAILRIAKNEHNDRVDYYRDQRSFDSADTSILLNKG